MKGIIASTLLSLFIVAAPAALPANAADVYGKIMAKKEIVIGISKHYPPLNFKAGKEGVEMEMAEKLGAFLGVRVTLVPLPVKEYVRSLEEGKVDIIMAGFSRNLKRARTIWFSDPYVTVTPGVLVNRRSLPRKKYGDEFEEDPISTIWDLKSLTRFTFAVKKGSAYNVLLDEHFPKMKRVLVENDEEGLKLLRQGKVDGFVHDSLFLQYLYNTSGSLRSGFTVLQGGSQTEALCMGLPFGDMVLKNQIDLFIAEMVRQGFIDMWLEEYSSR